MLREYLDEILDGKKTYDTCAYDTNHKISAEEYCSWHATGKWEDMIFQVKDMNKNYYAYDFENPRRLAMPIKIVKSGRVWTKIDDGIQMNVQERLF